MAFKTMDERLDAMVATAAKLAEDECGCCGSDARTVADDVGWLADQVRSLRADLAELRSVLIPKVGDVLEPGVFLASLDIRTEMHRGKIEIQVGVVGSPGPVERFMARVGIRRESARKWIEARVQPEPDVVRVRDNGIIEYE